MSMSMRGSSGQCAARGMRSDARVGARTFQLERPRLRSFSRSTGVTSKSPDLTSPHVDPKLNLVPVRILSSEADHERCFEGPLHAPGLVALGANRAGVAEFTFRRNHDGRDFLATHIARPLFR